MVHGIRQLNRWENRWENRFIRMGLEKGYLTAQTVESVKYVHEVSSIFGNKTIQFVFYRNVDGSDRLIIPYSKLQ